MTQHIAVAITLTLILGLPAALWLSSRVALLNRHRRIEKAIAVVRRHGLKPMHYLGTIGVQDEDLCNAIDELAIEGGYLICNARNEIVGAVSPLERKPPRLRLVVVND